MILSKDKYEEFALAICCGNEDDLQGYGLAKSTIQNYVSYTKGSVTNRALAREIYCGLNKRVLDLIDIIVDEGDSIRAYRKGKHAPCKIGPNKNKTISNPIASTCQLKLKFPSVKEEAPVTGSQPKLNKTDAMTLVKQMYEVTMEVLKKL